MSVVGKRKSSLRDQDKSFLFCNYRFYNLFVTDFMRRDLVYLSYRSTYHDLKLLLLTSNHASYPLVDAPDSRILIGSLSRHTLNSMLDEHLKGVYKHAQQIRERSLP